MCGNRFRRLAIGAEGQPELTMKPGKLGLELDRFAIGGDGFGHAARLAPIAAALAGHGLEARLALRSPEAARPILEPSGLTAIQAPLARIPARPDLVGLKTSSYADLLVRYSLDREPWLLAVTRAWDELLDDFRPDLVVADFAPALALAARGRVPVVHVGNGYTVPPAAGERFPKFRDLPDWVPTERLLATFNAVQHRRRRPPLQRLPDHFVGTVAEDVLGAAVPARDGALGRQADDGVVVGKKVVIKMLKRPFPTGTSLKARRQSAQIGVAFIDRQRIAPLARQVIGRGQPGNTAPDDSNTGGCYVWVRTFC